MAKIGSSNLRYEVLENWGNLPEGWSYGHVIGVAVDSSDKVYVFNCGEHPVIIYSDEGDFLGSWGEGVFTQPHGINIVAENVYCADT